MRQISPTHPPCPPRWTVLFLFLLSSGSLLEGGSARAAADAADGNTRCRDLRRAHEALQAQFRDAQRELTTLRMEMRALHELVVNPSGLPSPEGTAVERVLGNRDVGVRQSELAGGGRGAFALRSFDAGEIVGVYGCLLRPRESTTSDVARAWVINASTHCDGALVPLHNPMVYANSIAAEHTCHLQNVIMVLDSSSSNDGTPRVIYRSTRHIRVGAEIVVDYGAGFFATRGGVQYECFPSFITAAGGAQVVSPQLIIAAGRGDLKSVRRLIRDFKARAAERTVLGGGGGAGGDRTSVQRWIRDSVTRDRWTALMAASVASTATGTGQKVVAELLTHGAYIDQTDMLNRTALTIATGLETHVNMHVVRTLLTAGADPNHVPSIGDPSPLSAAATRGRAGLCLALLRAGANINQTTRGGNTPLMQAAQGGHVVAVRALLRRSGNVLVDAANDDGATALFAASYIGFTSVVDALIDANADPTRQTHTGATPLQAACQRKHLGVVNVLLRAGADPNVFGVFGGGGGRGGRGERRGKRDAGREARRAEDNVEAPSVHRFTGAGQQMAGTFDPLLSAPEAPLFISVTTESTAIVAALLKARADPNVKARNGATPLFAAAKLGLAGMVDMLIGAGANVNHTTQRGGATSLIVAASEGHVDVVDILLEARAEVDVFQNDGTGALFWAASKGHVDVVEALLDAGTNTAKTSVTGLTAHDAAVLGGHKRVADLLSKRGHTNARARDGAGSGTGGGEKEDGVAGEDAHSARSGKGRRKKKRRYKRKRGGRRRRQKRRTGSDEEEGGEGHARGSHRSEL